MDNFESFVNDKLKELREKLDQEKDQLRAESVPESKIEELIDQNRMLTQILEAKNAKIKDKNRKIKHLRKKLDKAEQELQRKHRGTAKRSETRTLSTETFEDDTPFEPKVNQDIIDQMTCDLNNIKKENRNIKRELELYKYESMKKINNSISKRIIQRQKSAKKIKK